MMLLNVLFVNVCKDISILISAKEIVKIIFVKKKRRPESLPFFRATHGTRTHDPRITNALLYQLS